MILYLAGTKSYAMLLPYKVNGSKLDSIHGRDGNEDSCEKVEVFTDSDGLATNQALPQGEDIQCHLR